MVRPGDIAPDFEQDTANGSIRFHEWLNRSWCVMFGHPGGVTPATAEEYAAAARTKADWSRRGVKLIALSAGSSDGHARWEKQLLEAEGWSPNFPVIADADGMVSRLYRLAERSAFVIDPDKKVRLTRTYPAGTLCDFQELLAIVDRLQGADAAQTLAPANDHLIDHAIDQGGIHDPQR